MKRSLENIKRIVKMIYGEHWKLSDYTETRVSETKEYLWDSVVFKTGNGQEMLDISYSDFEGIGYMITEYNELGDTPDSWDKFDLLVDALNEKEIY